MTPDAADSIIAAQQVRIEQLERELAEGRTRETRLQTWLNQALSANARAHTSAVLVAQERPKVSPLCLSRLKDGLWRAKWW